MKNNKMKMKNSKGFSLIEVLLAIVILGLVAAPILQMFVTSAQINLNSRELMAATEVATMTMEHITSMKMDGGEGSARDYFTKADPSGNALTRIPGVGYSATVTNLNVTYTDLTGFKGNTTAADDNTNNKTVYYAGATDGGTMGLMMNQVQYNGETFDVLVWCKPTTTVGKFYTYDVTVEVYSIDSVQVEKSDGSTYTDYVRYDECLVSINGAVANK